MIDMNNDTLNPKLFNLDTKKLYPDVRNKILEIAQEFKEYMELDFKILDVRIVGSNAAYNYSKNSDIDIHLVVNYGELSLNKTLIQILFQAEKSAFNKKYDIKIKGLEAEIYVEDVLTSAISNGIYSVLQDCWIKYPKKINEDETTLPDISNLYEHYAFMCKNIIEDFKYNTNKDLTSEDVSDLLDSIYMLRKNSLAKDGELGKGNLVFKELRKNNIIQQLNDIKDKLVSNELSLEKLDRERNFDYDY